MIVLSLTASRRASPNALEVLDAGFVAVCFVEEVPLSFFVTFGFCAVGFDMFGWRIQLMLTRSLLMKLKLQSTLYCECTVMSEG